MALGSRTRRTEAENEHAPAVMIAEKAASLLAGR